MRPTTRLQPKLLVAACVASLLLGSTAFGRATTTAASGAAIDPTSPRGQRQNRAVGAPEIDPSLTAAGLLVLVGGVLALTGRRRPATS